MAKFDSYKEPLTKVLELVKEKTNLPRIVEYGPGGSTKLMKQIIPDSIIVTVENKLKWYNKYKEEFSRFKNNNLKIFYCKLSQDYVEKPSEVVDSNSADLIYIDGRQRVRCLRLAKELLKKKTGLIVLHDAERKRYRPGYTDWPEKWRIWAGTKGHRTLILVSNKADFEKLRSLEREAPKNR
ncbi:MAG: hypothetical protein JXR70_03220 [Spirochaetales bacterium]|nr:hypothetical protein [Spirochaetales bacterium]